MADLDEALDLLRAAERRPADVRLPSAAALDAAEAAIGTTIPRDYRQFLAEASTISVGHEEPGLVGPDEPPVRDLVRIAHPAWDGWGVPRELFPFSTADGNFFCIAPDGRVVYWDHDGPNDESWPDLASWIKTVWVGGG